MPTFRHRTQSFVGPTGSRTVISTGVVDEVTYGDKVFACDDVVGNYPNSNGLSIDKYWAGDGHISGRSPVFPVYDWAEYPYTNQPSAGPIDGWDAGMPDATTSVTKVAAKTNPGRANLSVPVFIAELKDLPHMIRGQGDNILRKKSAARRRPNQSSVPTEQFGWSSLFRDLGSLLDFTAYVDKRVVELKSLYSSGGLKVGAKVWANSLEFEESSIPFNTVEANVYGTRTRTCIARRWASVRWRPTFPPPSVPTDAELLQKARFAVHGWRINPADAWELIPWSWLIDYFSNVGDVLNTTGNAWEYTCDNGCVMTSLVCVSSDRVDSTSEGFIAIPGKSRRELKLRVLANPGLSVFAPLLSAKQLTNLAAIAVNYGGLK
jgi:hypothetical protein